MSPDYSSWAQLYARSRPPYPAELFKYLAGLCERRDRAWDCATGNGQAALGLADYFESVVATDQSADQLLAAPVHSRIEFRVAPAEESGLSDGSVDLVTVASAVHWFDLEAFYREVGRVLRPSGVLAVWTYHVAHVDGVFGDVLWNFYQNVVGPYFSAGARLVDDRYKRLALPGRAIDGPEFWVEAEWQLDQLMAFVQSWSGTQSYMNVKGHADPTEALRGELLRAGMEESAHYRLRWPLYLKISRFEYPDAV